MNLGNGLLWCVCELSITREKILKGYMTFVALLREAMSSECCVVLSCPPTLSQTFRKMGCSCHSSRALLVPTVWSSAQLSVPFILSFLASVSLLNLRFLQVIRKMISFFLISAREEVKHREQQIRPYQAPLEQLRAVKDGSCRAAEEAVAVKWESRS